MENDPLEAVFLTPEERLAIYLKAMPPALQEVFQREFVRKERVDDQPAIDANGKLNPSHEWHHEQGAAWTQPTVKWSDIAP